MHCFMVQLEEENEFDRLTPGDLLDTWFVGTVADYVKYGDNWPQGTEICKYLSMLEPVSDSAVKVNKEKMRNYFWEKLDLIKKCAKVISETHLDEFINDEHWVEFYSIETNNDDDRGVYVYSDGEFYTLMHWLRANKDCQKTWYVGSVIDYHY